MKSTDQGENWDILSDNLPQGTPKLIMDKNSGSPGNRTLYCTIYHHGIYKTTNSGESWEKISDDLNDDTEFVWEISF